jgi:hypothetical protein
VLMASPGRCGQVHLARSAQLLRAPHEAALPRLKDSDRRGNFASRRVRHSIKHADLALEDALAAISKNMDHAAPLYGNRTKLGLLGDGIMTRLHARVTARSKPLTSGMSRRSRTTSTAKAMSVVSSTRGQSRATRTETNALQLNQSRAREALELVLAVVGATHRRNTAMARVHDLGKHVSASIHCAFPASELLPELPNAA